MRKRSPAERFLRAYNAGDVETIAGYYGDDLVKDRQPEKKAETVARVRGVFRDFSGSLSVANDEIVVSGDLAYARGTLRITLTPRRRHAATRGAPVSGDLAQARWPLAGDPDDGQHGG